MWLIKQYPQFLIRMRAYRVYTDDSRCQEKVHTKMDPDFRLELFIENMKNTKKKKRQSPSQWRL